MKMFYICAMARIGTMLKITDEDFKELTIMSRSNKLDHRYVVRSQIILKLYEGMSYDQVQKELHVGRAAVAKWKSRFLSKGMADLRDMSGRGKSPSIKQMTRPGLCKRRVKNQVGAVPTGASAG